MVSVAKPWLICSYDGLTIVTMLFGLICSKIMINFISAVLIPVQLHSICVSSESSLDVYHPLKSQRCSKENDDDAKQFPCILYSALCECMWIVELLIGYAVIHQSFHLLLPTSPPVTSATPQPSSPGRCPRVTPSPEP